MNGGSYENVAGCYTGKITALTSNTDATFISKYIDVYSGYSISNYGDAVYETSVSAYNQTSWFINSSEFITTNAYVFRRGGAYQWSGSGSFSFSRNNGAASNYISFRPACVVY